jgi:hypothetical protein
LVPLAVLFVPYCGGVSTAIKSRYSDFGRRRPPPPSPFNSISEVSGKPTYSESIFGTAPGSRRRLSLLGASAAAASRFCCRS